MEAGRQVYRPRSWAVTFALAAALSGCQSKGSVTEALDPAAIAVPAGQDGAAGALPAQATQSLGTGSTKITMLLPLSAPGTAGENGRKMLDGAKLAMTDIGNGLLTLTVEDTKGDSAQAGKLALQALTTGTKAVIGPTELPAAQHIATLSGSKRPPVLALADNFAGGAGVYAVRLGEADSAAAGAAGIAAKGGKKFVLFVAGGSNASAVEKRVANSLSIYGATLAVTVPYSAGDGAAKAVDEMASLVDTPDAVIIASGDASPSRILAALKSKGIAGKATSVVGTSRWLEHPMEPSFEGAYIAALDPGETGPIADRFRTTYNYPADVNVAYAYDMVALTAGIASAVGPDGFSKQVLENPSGFRGSTGLFRFRADGSSQRSMPFYRIEKGALKLVAKSTSGF
ncbi:ABC transporter substrate-binding protein [Mesorhizobium sp. BR1-1-9]|uniref:ABC transporter substrate-binding protein n=1 Tax=unclassified Mesorhizobium TaxID=325217 RepID=UPI00112C1E13|nr:MULTISPECIES: ABC transporter substrate-binding protein [unclassified Mesorhizobium]MBZ9810535.1 ABC transporter substrate-binding protein [Mesorhizobium sp. ESP-6-2]MBZ9869326.1 ABC transporter substrate-binding protein [Mesorhizobium sp. BR1-1-9]MBZ9944828.1 ABC transporter substrate-binding protein [Mesorhizobium sp. BR1-1-13]TPM25544.1 ABC transporter substrate-binding protein [Mesorhizobium sp. B2-2-2]